MPADNCDNSLPRSVLQSVKPSSLRSGVRALTRAAVVGTQQAVLVGVLVLVFGHNYA